MVRKTSESYEDTLSRLDIPPENTLEKEAFKQYLVDELGITNVDFIESLWEAQKTEITLADMGIKGIPIKYPWGVEVRYGIQGLPGLWGYDTVRRIIEEEE